MEINKRIAALREKMKERGIDAYVAVTGDYHQSEYIGDYFKTREFLTGFTGSAGTCIISQKKAALWSDGRYFIQARMQIKGSEIVFYPMGEDGVADIYQYLEENLPKGGCIGFDGKCTGNLQGERFLEIARKKGGRIAFEEDLTDAIWEKRPPLSKEKAFLLKESYSGKSAKDKIEEIRQDMRKKGADICLLSSLDDIGWLLNIRGRDIDYCPLLLAYLLISKDRVELYTDASKLGGEIERALADSGVSVFGYEDIFQRVRDLKKEESIWIDPEVTSFFLVHSLPKEMKKIKEPNPTLLKKAIKNPVEIENLKEAHRKDGIAMVRFLCWLKGQNAEELSELSVSQKTEEFRSQQKDFIEPSFAPICAYGEHGAIVHYSASEESNIPLQKRGFLLADTGGHYMEGSTDITRTLVMGPLSDRERFSFTLVLMAMLRLMNTKFLYGCSGGDLDLAARSVLWKQGLDYKHGTGHGVGYLGNIHEGPQSFRRQHSGQDTVLEAGMVITDEPGLYIEGAYGIRIENELLVVKKEKNSYGQFMGFEPLTYVPIDIEGIDKDLMTREDIEYLNAYHALVFEKLSPHMEGEELEWLKKNTRPL